jgi:hypothetical protein
MAGTTCWIVSFCSVMMATSTEIKVTKNTLREVVPAIASMMEIFQPRPLIIQWSLVLMLLGNEGMPVGKDQTVMIRQGPALEDCRPWQVSNSLPYPKCNLGSRHGSGEVGASVGRASIYIQMQVVVKGGARANLHLTIHGIKPCSSPSSVHTRPVQCTGKYRFYVSCITDSRACTSRTSGAQSTCFQDHPQ